MPDADPRFADRMVKGKKSFIREILKVTEQPDVISFAGGLPDPALFPFDAVSRATVDVMQSQGAKLLQYTTTEGYQPLRERVADRYAARGQETSPDDILFTNGSQQGLDLAAKLFINKGDAVIIEAPGYLGAIQAFSLYEPEFRTVPLTDDGVDIDALKDALKDGKAVMYYAIPNFQNPSGRTYSADNRAAVAALLSRSGIAYVEDDPYGDLRFRGERLPSITELYDGPSLALGSFSKTVAPGLRLGWLRASHPSIMDKLVAAKQASDLHTGILAQHILERYHETYDGEAHIAMLASAYGSRCAVMQESIRTHFPDDVRVSDPDGGMFIWVELPEHLSAMDLFDEAIRDRVAFVPGAPFYVDGGGRNTLRLNFSNATRPVITDGIERLGNALTRMLG